MRLAPWLVAAVSLFAVYRLYSHRDIAHGPGVLAAADPRQTDPRSEASIARDGFVLKPRAEFSATVRILHREDYSVGDLARLVPTDFAVGWGRMSDSTVLADVDISQGNRFYYWHTNNWPIERQEIEEHSANWHVIPENSSVRAVLDRLRIGSVVELRGELVDIEGEEASMRTSLTRSDTGAGACEVLLASQARIVAAK